MNIIKEILIFIIIIPIVILNIISLVGVMALPIILPMLLVTKSNILLFFTIMGLIGIIIFLIKERG